ncbi:MipA/OmpV family protein [uncultured Cetobacterium sp.]|uniref:MipA/OmpV family protein n=1 Tax=uncultured Cetobacterium sp. TaxID=527638 RepID=UPI002614369A|nr:MipA/OmpV family protein [uncultured Cetobacterium sp.]
MKKFLLGLLALTITMTTFSDDKFGIGAGIGISDSIYKGSNEKAYFMPLLDINYGDLYAKGSTLGYNLYQDDVFAASLFVDPLAGFSINGANLATGYDGIDDRDFQIMFGLRLDAKTGFYGVKTGLSAQVGEHGAKAKASLFKPYNINDRLILIPSIYIKGYSGDYTDYYFGVTSEEARNNKNIDKDYTANAAYSVGVSFIADYKLTDNVALMAFLGIEQFSSEISDSPIIEDGVLYLIGVGAKYYF